MEKHQVHNLIILDESGSMNSIKTNILQGFNEIVQTVKGVQEQFLEQSHFISMVSFNGLGIKTHLFAEEVSKIQELNAETYHPDASTPLYDAMGYALNRLNQFLQNQKPYNVLVTILTDGEENSSKEYSGAAIKKLVEELGLQNWTFTYIGADHDVAKVAMSLSITNTVSFEKNEGSMSGMFDKEREARVAYSKKIRSGEDTKDGFYKA
jgi:Mg-chelatase subunit ChlD